MRIIERGAIRVHSFATDEGPLPYLDWTVIVAQHALVNEPGNNFMNDIQPMSNAFPGVITYPQFAWLGILPDTTRPSRRNTICVLVVKAGFGDFIALRRTLWWLKVWVLSGEI